MEMTTLTELETQVIQLERAIAVLQEATEHIEKRIDPGFAAEYFAQYTAPHMLLLLHVAGNMAHGVEKDLRKIIYGKDDKK